MTGEVSGLKELLGVVASGRALDVAQAERAFDIIMSGDATPAQMGGFLMALRVRGETIAEITGAARAMRAKMLTIEAPEGAVDTCGTGGDATGTYNISTGSSLVVAACGVPVAKHGNRALSSKAGAADVLTALGVNIDADMSLVKQALWQAKICFLMAPRHHSAMRHVGPARVELGTRTIFNLLGPLSNPARVKRQTIGVFAPDWVEPMAQALKGLGHQHAWVFHGAGGLDELSTIGPSRVAELKDGAVATFEVTAADAGLATATLADLRGGDAEHNAEAMRALFDGAPGAFRDIVILGAAAALIVAGKAADLKDGASQAAAAIDSGRARDTLAQLIAITNQPPPAGSQP
jgi:anthranilate phosphoribosyltransferase